MKRRASASFCASTRSKRLNSGRAKLELRRHFLNDRFVIRAFTRVSGMPRAELSSFARPLFSRFDVVLAQNDALARRFMTLGAPKSIAVGNLRVDAPAPSVDDVEFRQVGPRARGRPLLFAACTHEGEDAIVSDAHSQLAASLAGLVHHSAPSSATWEGIGETLKSRGLNFARRSFSNCRRSSPIRWANLACSTSRSGGVHRWLACRSRQSRSRGGHAARRNSTCRSPSADCRTPTES